MAPHAPAPPGPTSRTAEDLFVTHLDLIERVIAFVCARHHLTAADADDFASHVKLKFVEDRYAVFAKFAGRSSLRTYLIVVIQRIFLDYRISAWGKWRPSAEAKRGGEVAVLLERLIVRDGHTFDEAVELMTTNHGVSVDRTALEQFAAKLPVRVKRRFESEEVLNSVAAPERAPDEVASERDRQDLADRVSAVMRRVMATFETQDQLILTLRYEDGRAVSDIAAALHLNQKPLYRRLERLAEEFRKALEAEGIDSQSVMEMFESPAVSVSWREERDEETERTRPSMNRGSRQ